MQHFNFANWPNWNIIDSFPFRVLGQEFDITADLPEFATGLLGFLQSSFLEFLKVLHNEFEVKGMSSTFSCD